MDRIVLASASTGRKTLFEKYFTSFIISVSDFDENSVSDGDPAELTRLLALNKTRLVSQRFPSDFVAGFDTVVVCEGKILGKPSGPDEAGEILRFLSGKSQSVLSGYSIINRNRNIEISGVGVTVLDFKRMDEEFIKDYIYNNPVTRYAGGYAVQDKDGLVEIVSGSFENVIGAPMDELVGCLRKAGAPEGVFKKTQKQAH
jgi:septum formation protein